MSLLAPFAAPAPDLTADEAMVLTAKIKAHVCQAWVLIHEAHDRKAHKALGYATFEDYVRDEFDLSRSRAYQLLDQARVIRELAEAAGMSTTVDTQPMSTDVDTGRVSPDGDTAAALPPVTEAAARDIKPVLPAVAEDVRERVANGTPPADAIREAVNHARSTPPDDPARAAAITANAVEHIAHADPSVADGFARAEVRKAIVATHRLLDLDPDEAARLLPGPDDAQLDRWADRIATWADQFRRARHPLTVIEGEAR